MMEKADKWSWKALVLLTLVSSLVGYSTGQQLGFGQEDYTQTENTGSVSIEVIKLGQNVEPIVVNIMALTFEQFDNTPGAVLPQELQAIVDDVDPAELDGTRNDFDSTVQQVTFAPSQANSEQILSVNLVDDTINEAQEGFYIMIQVVQSGPTDQITFIRNGVALIRITDNDLIRLGFGQIDYSVAEDTGIFQPGPVTVIKEDSRVSEQILSINLEFTDITATSGVDYSGVGMLLTLNPEDSSLEIPIIINADLMAESNEIFLGSLNVPTNPPDGLLSSATAATTTITIIDDESVEIGFEFPSYTFQEGVNAVAEVCFTILSPPLDQIDPISVFALINVEPFQDSAEENLDYTVPPTYVPSALIDVTTNRDCRSVTLEDDSLIEPIESFLFRLTLSSGQFDVNGNFQVTTAQAEVFILDNDAQDVVIEFDPVSYIISEGSQQAVMFRIVALTPVSADTTVLFSTLDQAATAPADYVARSDVQVTFAVGESEQFVEVMIVDDSVLEGDEVFVAVLSLQPGSSGVVLGAANEATATIEDDDTVTIRFNPTSYQVLEGQLVNFVIELIGDADISTSVTFMTSDSSAIFSEDYVATTELVTFNPGQNNRSVTVQTLTDTLVEGNEMFEASLSLVAGTGQAIVLEDNIATATILDNSELFLTPSPTITAIEGEMVEITCGPIGPEEITIQVNGVQSPLLFQDSGMQRVFTFGPVNRVDQGTVFQCFSGALSSTMSTLNVFYPPEYMFMILYEGNEGDPLTITLGLDGNPLPPDAFTWTFNGQPLQLGGNIITLNENTIAFSSLNRDNAGSYGVSATNLAGQGSAAFDLAVFYPPEYNISQSFTVNEGDTFNLSSLNLDANPIPGDGNYSWTFNGQPLMSGPGIELGVNSFLLSTVLRNQSGVYTISSFNRAGSGETSFALNVNYPPTYTVDERFTPTEGTPFRVDLGLDANPIPETGMFEWFFNGQPLGPGVVTGVDFIDFGNSISRDASGNYTVSSFNEAGSGNASFVIDVLYPPLYNLTSNTFTVAQGETFDLEIDLEGNPFPVNAMWSFNGQPLPMISGIELGVNFIRIQMVTPLDEGMYTVETANSVGMDSVSFQLLVQAPTTTQIPNPTSTLPVTATALPVDATVAPSVSPTPNGDGFGGDPHFSVLLPNGQQLCFSLQGEHGFVFSLISNKIIHINAKFIPDGTRSEVTWIGSLGVVVRSKASNTTTKLRFEASDEMVYVGDKVTLNAQSVKKLTFTNGKLTIDESDDPNGGKKTKPRVEVDLKDVGMSFMVRFVKGHIDMVWNKVRKQPKDSHGIIGQFFRDHVEIDEARRLLLLPGMDPVAVMRKPVWHFMEREEVEDELCWVAMNPGYQGKKLIEGHYLDYLVDDVLSSSFKFRPGKYKRSLEQLLGH